MASDDDGEDAVRLMFDAYEPLATRELELTPKIRIQIVCAADSKPGALQSGVFLWPAARTLARWLAERWRPEWRVAVELGAGAGVGGLAAAKLMESSSSDLPGVVYCTDRDMNSIRLVRKSVKASGLNLSDAPKVRLKTRKVNFGKEDEANGFASDLGFGSDLVYSSQVARDLMSTIAVLGRTSREPAEWRFCLCSSFRDEETTSIVAEACRGVGLEREVLQELGERPSGAETEEGQHLIELFRLARAA